VKTKSEGYGYGYKERLKVVVFKIGLFRVFTAMDKKFTAQRTANTKRLRQNYKV